ncbi:hypothetical protein BJX68DRAFT_244560 [Aspergillus pseudodeflectus]|uniref:Transmembrane protein n=1 Tax=Aspergillus pseudodeflectus TaxID=176178 RepID=A0ABR4JRD2_9EURO
MPCPLWYSLTFLWKPYQDSTIKHIITEANETTRNKMIENWVKSRTHEADTVLIIGTLTIGVTAASLSWFETSAMPWSILACWYCSLFTGFASVGTTALLAMTFKHISDTTGYENEVRVFLGTATTDTTQNLNWVPNYWYIYILQIPVMMLKLSHILFILGLEIQMWDAALQTGLIWSARETKIAIMSTTCLAVSVVHYCLFSFFLFGRSFKRKVA